MGRARRVRTVSAPVVCASSADEAEPEAAAAAARRLRYGLQAARKVMLSGSARLRKRVWHTTSAMRAMWSQVLTCHTPGRVRTRGG